MTEPARGAGPGRQRWLLVGIVFVVSAIAFEAIAVATAMPVVARELDGLRGYGLAFSAFLTTSLIGMVVAGQVCDRRGPHGPAIAATGVFCLGLLGAAGAPTMTALVFARAVQGLGGGAAVVALYVVVARAYDDRQRPRVFSVMSGAWVVPAIAGPPVAGALADHVSWRWVFLGVLPLVLGGAAIVRPHLSQASEPVADLAAIASRRARLRPAFMVAVGAGLLQTAAYGGGGSAVLIASTAAVLLAIGVPRLLPPGAVRLARGLPTVVVLRGVFAGAFFGAESFLPLLLTEQRGLGTATSGASLTGGAVAWACGAWLQARPPLRVHRVRLVGVGLVLVAVGIGMVAAVAGTSVSVVLAAVGWCLAGFGMGVGVTTVSVLLLELSPAAEQGGNSAALQVSDALGSVLVIGLLGGAFATLHQDDAIGRMGGGGAFVVVFAAAALVAAAGAAISQRAATGTRAAR
ncbi:MAG: MFS transporter [Angustibacter sp.]